MPKKKMKVPVFVHVPKTGGNYVKMMMRAYGVDRKFSPQSAGHYVFGKRKTLFQNCTDWKKYQKHGIIFCTVRNPFDMLVSWFFHGENGFRDMAEDCNSFEDFLQKYIDKELPYKDFCENPFCQLYDDKGNFVPEKVLRQENLSKELKEFLEKDCGLTCLYPKYALPVRDRTPRRGGLHYRMFYQNPEHVKELERRWKPILHQFGYSFKP